MIVKEIISNGNSVRITQHDGKTCTLYEVSLNGKALKPVSNLTLALKFFDSLCEKSHVAQGN